MAKITRVTQKIFAGDLTANKIGVFGSFANGTPTYTTDPATVQSLANWTGGWPTAIVGGSNPALQDVNAVDFVYAYQLAYLMQEGVAEWDAATTYYIGSIANDGTGVLYRSIQNTNLNHALSDATWWSEIGLPAHPGVEGEILTTTSTTAVGWTSSPLFLDIPNTRIGVNTTSPQNKAHVNGANATATYMQVTNGTTTGVTSADGSLFGVDASGNLVINQQEALPINLFTNGSQAGSISSAQLWTVGPSSGLTAAHIIQNSNTSGYVLKVKALTATSGVRGLKIQAGLAAASGTSSEIPFSVSNCADTADYFTVAGDGSCVWNNNNNVQNGAVNGSGKWTFGASAGTQAHVANGSMEVIFSSGNPQLYIQRSSTSTGRYSFGTSSNALTIRDEGQSADRLTISSAGLVSILASGLLLPGANSTTMDYFQEGSYTPTVQINGASATVSPSWFYRAGSKVTVWGFCAAGSATTGTASVTLPISASFSAGGAGKAQLSGVFWTQSASAPGLTVALWGESSGTRALSTQNITSLNGGDTTFYFSYRI